MGDHWCGQKNRAQSDHCTRVKTACMRLVYSKARGFILPLGQASIDLDRNKESTERRNQFSNPNSMARFRRRKHSNSFSGNGELKARRDTSSNILSADDGAVPISAELVDNDNHFNHRSPFLPQDAKKLIEYLRNYRDRATKLYYDQQMQSSCEGSQQQIDQYSFAG